MVTKTASDGTAFGVAMELYGLVLGLAPEFAQSPCSNEKRSLNSNAVHLGGLAAVFFQLCLLILSLVARG